ncbi:MAG: hypothetical protein IJ514_06125 [Clostridia bacterium]|nr:hypothetical protein [Clostridia bacterium]
MKFKKQIALALAATSCLSLVACNKQVTPTVTPTAPDYSAYSHKLSFYCYNPPNDGTWNIDKTKTPAVRGSAGEDFRTVERYKEYKDCGFDILMMQSSGKYSGQDWETSDTKMVMDRAYEAGIEKIIVTDGRLQGLSEGIIMLNEQGEPDPDGEAKVTLSDKNGDGVKQLIDLVGEGLIGEHSPFKSEEEVDAYVAECMAPYKDYKGFYGVQLKDEPNFKHVTFYGDTYEAIKRVCPTAFVQYNLNQVYTDYTYFWGYPGWEGAAGETIEESVYAYESTYREDRDEQGNILLYDVNNADKTIANAAKAALAAAEQKAKAKAKAAETEIGFKRYGDYLKAYIENTGADYIMWDSYPLEGDGVRAQYIRSMQVTADVCRDTGVKFANTTQTDCEVSGVSESVIYKRKVTEEGARWLNNMLLGFGVKEIVYYTYFNKGNEYDGKGGTNYPDGTSFITHYGQKTDLYYFMQQIIAEDQKFAPVIMNFDYVTSNVYSVSPSTYSTEHVRMAQRGNAFQKVKEISINKECALATELYDKANDRYMYMVQNVVDPKYQGAKAYQTATVEFKDGYTHALVYRNGEPTTVKLDGGKLEVKQHAGEAVFVIPY